jgi:hypothetical protein
MPHNAVLLDTDNNNNRVTDTSDFTTRLLVTVKKVCESRRGAVSRRKALLFDGSV